MIRATPGQLQALDALCDAAGDYPAASDRLGIREGTCRARLRKLRERNEGRPTIQLLLERDRERRAA